MNFEIGQVTTMKPKTHLQRTGLTSTLATIAIVIGIGLNSARAQITPVGGIARDFTITNHMTGQPLHLYDYQGKIILLEFWAYWCSYCQKAARDIEPGITQYYRTNGGNAQGAPVQVISISIDPADPAQVNNFIQTYGLELVGDDLFGEAYSQFGGSGIPQMTVINGMTNSPNFQPWEVVHSRLGYNQNLVDTLRTQIDRIQATPPVCNVVSPSGGGTVSPPVTLTASVTDNGVIIKKVDFYHGSLLIGSATNPPYTVNWNIATEGENSVVARAFYGASSRSDSVPVTFTVGSAPPNVIVHPTNRTVSLGGSNYFTVVATGSGSVSYQWQKDQVNLSNGGHYSSCTEPAMLIVNCDASDVASYRCVVSNAHGTNISNPATLTVLNANVPPRIAQQPSHQTVTSGETASFFILAGGSEPLTYQWQKNGTNLCNDGHCSGTATGTLTISEAGSSDVADYRCAVTNAFGMTNSATVTLALASVAGCTAISDPDFESGFSTAGGGYTGNGWTEWETDAGGVIGYDETSITHGGGHAQRLRLSGGVYGTSGGVSQRVPTIPGLSYTVGVWMYAGDALTSCSLGVHPSGGTNAASGVTWSTVTTNVAWVQKSVTVTATSNYITIFYKVASSDSVKRNGYFDDATPAGSNGPIQLLARRDGNALTLAWPECPGARLERADTLSGPAAWATVTNPISRVGGQKSVTVTPLSQSGTGFFRLVQE
jgi:thiol-disulfide isomerase/thioredoxin